MVTSAVLTASGLRTSLGIPDNGSCGFVPKRVLKVTSAKLKSPSAGLVLLALSFNTGVSFRKTSFKAALFYSVDVLSVIAAFDGVAKPSISPSEIKS